MLVSKTISLSDDVRAYRLPLSNTTGANTGTGSNTKGANTGTGTSHTSEVPESLVGFVLLNICMVMSESTLIRRNAEFIVQIKHIILLIVTGYIYRYELRVVIFQ
jgi:hypothetical protein